MQSFFQKDVKFWANKSQDGKKPLEVMLAQIRAIRANRFPGKEPGDGEVFVRLRPLATLHLLHPSDLVVWCLLPVLWLVHLTLLQGVARSRHLGVHCQVQSWWPCNEPVNWDAQQSKRKGQGHFAGATILGLSHPLLKLHCRANPDFHLLPLGKNLLFLNANFCGRPWMTAWGMPSSQPALGSWYHSQIGPSWGHFVPQCIICI
jgi:hypothetical protein